MGGAGRLRRVSVEDHVDQLAGGHRRLGRAQEPQELPVAVPGPAAAEHRAVQDIEGGEQRGGAMADMVVGRRPGLAGLGRQPRPSSAAP
jgi:hypothetical protein